MLIGLTGAAGAGKGSVAHFLVHRHGFAEIAFADPLYAAVEAITGISQTKLKDRRHKEEPIDWIGKSPRELLQLLGTEFGRKMVKESLWVDRAMRRVIPFTVITDVRFDNEAAAIKGRGGVIWEVVRPGQACLVGEAASHESEHGIMRDLVDLTLFNEGTLDDLAASVDAAMREATRLYNT